MPLETLEAGAPLNVRSLQTEYPQKRDGLPFDTKTEVTTEDWRRVIEELITRKDKSEARWWKYLPSVLILDPEKRDEIGDVIWQYSNALSSLEEIAFDWDAFTRNPVSPLPEQEEFFSIDRIIIPGWSRSRLNPHQSHIFSNAKNAFAQGIGSVRSLSNYKLAFPELDKSAVQRQWANTQLEGAKDTESYFATAAQLRIISPALTFNTPDYQWVKARQKLREARSEQTLMQFVQLASNMKIVAAESVEVTEDGLKLVMPERSFLQSAHKPIPEIRSF